jgi:hypothetical protein
VDEHEHEEAGEHGGCGGDDGATFHGRSVSSGLGVSGT